MAIKLEVILKKILKEVAFDRNYKHHPMNKNIVRFGNIIAPTGWFEYLTKTQNEALNLLFIIASFFILNI